MRQLFTIMIMASLAFNSGSLFANNCLSEVTATYSEDFRTVYVTSTKELSNVVLLFADSTEYKFDDLDTLETHSDTFTGIEENLEKCIIGVWIKSGCNGSDDGPGYGEFVVNPDWEDVCPSLEEEQPPAPPTRHLSTVFNSGFGLREAGFSDVANPSLEAFPNPVASHDVLNIRGLGQGSTMLNIISIDGRLVASTEVDETGVLQMDRYDLTTGMYFLQLADGNETLKILVK